MLNQIREVDPPAPSMVRSAVDPDLERICLKALNKQPAARYSSAREMADDMRNWIDRPRRSRSAALTFGLAFLGIVIALAVIVIRFGNNMITVESDPRKVPTITIDLDDAATTAHAAPDGANIADATSPPQVELTLDWRALGSQPDAASFFCFRYSPDGQRIAADGFQPGVGIWNVADGRRLQEFSGHTSEVQSVCWSLDGEQLASASRDGTVRIWNTTSGEALNTITTDCEYPAADWSPDGRWLVYAAKDYKLVFRDVATGEESRRAAHTHEFYDIAWSPDGRVCASAGNQAGQIYLWSETDVEPTGRYRPGIHDVFCLAWSPDSRYIACGSAGNKHSYDNQSIHIFDVTTGAFLDSPVVEGVKSVRDIAWHPTRPLIASGHMHGELQLRHAHTLALESKTSFPEYINGVSFSPDGTRLVHTQAVNTFQQSIVADSPAAQTDDHR